jgi:hypothetical protein
MKKLIRSIAIVFAAGAISLHASGEKVHLKLVFEAVDAKGNRDTVEYAIRDKATNGIDKELGEVNIYGQAPKGDLDMRLVQRKAKDASTSWLRGQYPMTISGFSENADLKKDYRTVNTYDPGNSTDLAIKVFAKYYPINIQILSISNLNSLFQFNRGAEIDWDTFDELSTSSYGNVVEDDSNQNITRYSLPLYKEDAEKSKKFFEGDTIYNFIEKPLLLSYLGRRNFTFIDSSSRNYIIGLKFFPRGLGCVEDLKNTIKPYPNPSKNFVMINEGNEGDTFEILNYSGDKVATFAVEEFPYKHDISKLPAGIYYLINTKSGKDFGKFVKE